jgi:hypothetical protein
MKPVICCASVLVVTFAASLHAAAPPAWVDAARVKVLLRRLDDDNFFKRQRADADLRAMGKPVLPLLLTERDRTRSLEVRYRIDRMVRELTYDREVSRLVQLLGHDNRKFSDLADGALRQAGTAVLPLLKKELRAEMNATSRARLEKIVADLSSVRR